MNPAALAAWSVLASALFAAAVLPGYLLGLCLRLTLAELAALPPARSRLLRWALHRHLRRENPTMTHDSALRQRLDFFHHQDAAPPARPLDQKVTR